MQFASSMMLICARLWVRLPTVWRLRCITRCINGDEGAAHREGGQPHDGWRIIYPATAPPPGLTARVNYIRYVCREWRRSISGVALLEPFFMSIDQNQLRLLPSVDELLQSSSGSGLITHYSRNLTLRAVRAAIAQARFDILNGSACPSAEQLLGAAEQTLRGEQQPQLRSVINATGVIINTNLGRSPLSQEALQAIQQVAGGYSNLEYDMEAGRRGSRHAHVAALLRELTGAEAALVTNNNAAAVLLALSTLAMGREVIISRGQLVEIGGGFRVPDVLRQSGCLLVEVGTTNRTRISDYEAALSERSALLLNV